jgi:hypothetical protein
MSTTLREMFAQHASNVGPPNLDIDELVELGEGRLRRRRLTAVLGSVAAVVVVIALALAVGAGLNGPLKRTDGPVDRPTSSPEPPLPRPVRKIVYSDPPLFAHTTGSIHFGDHAVETDDGFVHIDVTDDGFVYTREGRAWFSDGGKPIQIGSHLCGASPSGVFSSFANRSVMTANAGSLAAWFDCSEAARPTLVVYDTASRIEVARRPIAYCRRSCELVDVTADYVYFDRGGFVGSPRPEYRFGVTTHQLRVSSPQSYAGDLSSHTRGLVVGGSWQTGTATNGIGQGFSVVGSRLVPLGGSRNGEEVLTHAFDTATRHAVRLRLSPGYRSERTEGFVLFEWLDDDTVALAATGSGNGLGNILTCRLADGRCDLTLKRGTDTNRGPEVSHRIVPHLPLPG